MVFISLSQRRADLIFGFGANFSLYLAEILYIPFDPTRTDSIREIFPAVSLLPDTPLIFISSG